MATTIRIADTTRPFNAHPTDSEDESNAVDNGIYKTRKFNRTASSSSQISDHGISNLRNLTRTFSHTSSKDKRGLKGGEKELEDDDPGLRQSGDFKSRQVRPSTQPQRARLQKDAVLKQHL